MSNDNDDDLFGPYTPPTDEQKKEQDLSQFDYLFEAEQPVKTSDSIDVDDDPFGPFTIDPITRLPLAPPPADNPDDDPFGPFTIDPITRLPLAPPPVNDDFDLFAPFPIEPEPVSMPAREGTPDEVYDLMAEVRREMPLATPLIKEGAKDAPPQETLKGDIDLVRAAVLATPNSDEFFKSRESYRDYGYAIKAALPDNPTEALAIYQEWCGRWDGGTNNPDVVASDWRRMKPPFRRGASWIYDLATKYSGGAFTMGDVYFREDLAASAQTTAGNSAGVDDDIGLNPVVSEVKPIRVNPASFDEAADMYDKMTNVPIIKGLLDQKTLSVLYGAPNVGKSFVALMLAYHIARGMPWAGLRVNPVGVCYVAAEGGNGIRKRAAALKRKHGSCPNFHFIMAEIDLFNPLADLKPLIEALKELGNIGFVVLDTVARVMAGGDENHAKDMGTFIRNIDLLSKAVGCHVMLVHHTGKDASRGARGSSSLLGAIDTEIEISEGLITVTKQRDIDKNFDINFALDVVELSKDADGDPITSCTVRLMADAPDNVKAEVNADIDPTQVATKGELEILHIMEVLSAGRGGPGTELKRAEILDTHTIDRKRQDVARKHLTALVVKQANHVTACRALRA